MKPPAKHPAGGGFRIVFTNLLLLVNTKISLLVLLLCSLLKAQYKKSGDVGNRQFTPLLWA